MSFIWLAVSRLAWCVCFLLSLHQVSAQDPPVNVSCGDALVINESSYGYFLYNCTNTTTPTTFRIHTGDSDNSIRDINISIANVVGCVEIIASTTSLAAMLIDIVNVTCDAGARPGQSVPLLRFTGIRLIDVRIRMVSLRMINTTALVVDVSDMAQFMEVEVIQCTFSGFVIEPWMIVRATGTSGIGMFVMSSSINVTSNMDGHALMVVFADASLTSVAPSSGTSTTPLANNTFMQLLHSHVTWINRPFVTLASGSTFNVPCNQLGTLTIQVNGTDIASANITVQNSTITHLIDREFEGCILSAVTIGGNQYQNQNIEGVTIGMIFVTAFIQASKADGVYVTNDVRHVVQQASIDIADCHFTLHAVNVRSPTWSSIGASAVHIDGDFALMALSTICLTRCRIDTQVPILNLTVEDPAKIFTDIGFLQSFIVSIGNVTHVYISVSQSQLNTVWNTNGTLYSPTVVFNLALMSMTVSTALVMVDGREPAANLSIRLTSCRSMEATTDAVGGRIRVLLRASPVTTLGAIQRETTAINIVGPTDGVHLLLDNITIQAAQQESVTFIGSGMDASVLPVIGWMSLVTMLSALQSTMAVVEQQNPTFGSLLAAIARSKFLANITYTKDSTVTILNCTLLDTSAQGSTTTTTASPSDSSSPSTLVLYNRSSLFLGSYYLNTTILVVREGDGSGATSDFSCATNVNLDQASHLIVVRDSGQETSTAYYRPVIVGSALWLTATTLVNLTLRGGSTLLITNTTMTNHAGVSSGATAVLLASAHPSITSSTLLHVRDPGSKVRVVSSAFTGYDMFLPFFPNVVWEAGTEFSIACNTWNSNPLPAYNVSSRDSSVGSLRPLLSIPRSIRTIDAYITVCGRDIAAVGSLFSETNSAPASISVELPVTVIIDIPTFSPNAGLLAAAAADSIHLITLGQSTCSAPALKEATSSTRFLVSPFVDYGGEAASLGNIGLCLLIGLLHAAFVAWSHRRLAASASSASEVAKTSSRASAPPIALMFNARQLPTTQYFPAAAVSQFPAHTISAALYAINGVGFFAANTLTFGQFVALEGERRSASIACGVIASCVVVGCIGVYLYADRVLLFPGRYRFTKSLLSSFRYRRFSYAARRVWKSLPAWVFPTGHWEPHPLRAMLGVVRNSANQDHAMYALLPAALSLASNTVVGVEGGSVWCTVMWVTLCVIAFIGLAVFAMIQPSRTPCVNVLRSLQYAFQLGVYIASALSARDETSATVAVTVLMAFSVLSTMVSIVRLAHTILVTVWERRVMAIVIAEAARRNAAREESLGDGKLEQSFLGSDSALDTKRKNSVFDDELFLIQPRSLRPEAAATGARLSSLMKHSAQRGSQRRGGRVDDTFDLAALSTSSVLSACRRFPPAIHTRGDGDGMDDYNDVDVDASRTLHHELVSYCYHLQRRHQHADRMVSMEVTQDTTDVTALVMLEKVLRLIALHRLDRHNPPTTQQHQQSAGTLLDLRSLL